MSSYPRPAAPSFKKGEFVVPLYIQFRGKVFGTRKMTADEKAAWYADPDNQGMGDDGESKITSGTKYVVLPEGTQMIVTRARVSAQVGWHTVGNLCEVKVIATNEILIVARRELQVGQ